MAAFLLSVHVIAAILTIGPIAVAASLFPRYARQAAPTGGAEPDERAAGVAALLHRICRGYAVVGITVPVFGLATGAQLGVLTDAWLLVSILLTAVAAGILALAILPHQQRMLAPPEEAAESDALRRGAARLSGLTGAFNLLWAIVVVLMIVRPGSTTGV
ncbi:hypothetical protein ACFOVU_17030 [Nocardiopsis sediminis]|uniref:DUF2269 family protein n=1 Tax=Nocardiopsis sediminis TaxID=1778267 RepID=A0ABV8FNL5_9ACTN